MGLPDDEMTDALAGKESLVGLGFLLGFELSKNRNSWGDIRRVE